MPVALIACIGVLGLVLDVGIFRVIDSEFENAADAAALAAAWYDPVCPVVDRTAQGGLPVDPRCVRPDDNYQNAAFDVARKVAASNLGLASKLCATAPELNPPPNVKPIRSPDAQAISVIVTCNAPYLAGAVLQAGSGSSQIIRWATAGLGSIQLDGTYAYVSNQDPQTFPLLTSLVPL